jgi:hypothetical protein
MTTINPETGELETEGCWCDMVEKAKDPEVSCWIHENGFKPGLDFGWAEELNNVQIK